MNNNYDSSSCIITYSYTTKRLTKEIIEEHFDGKGNLIKRVIINEYEDNLWQPYYPYYPEITWDIKPKEFIYEITC